MDLKGKHYITIRVKGYGDIKLELDEMLIHHKIFD